MSTEPRDTTDAVEKIERSKLIHSDDNRSEVLVDPLGLPVFLTPNDKEELIPRRVRRDFLIMVAIIVLLTTTLILTGTLQAR
jgi:hypothetical protein